MNLYRLWVGTESYRGMAYFSYTIESEHLSRGLRPSKRAPRNSKYLVECTGAVGADGVLQVPDELTRMATTVITDAFPYPQIFVFINVIVVCGSTKIYEWVADALIEKLTVLPGSTWSAIDLHDAVYMSNGTVAVTRCPMSKVWASWVVPYFPRAMAICNFNSQCIVGSPSIDGAYPGASLNMAAGPIDVTVSAQGNWI